MKMEPKYISHRLQTIVRDQYDVRRYLISTAYCISGFSQVGQPEWETMVFPYDGEEVDYSDECEQFRTFFQDIALRHHLWCVERYSM
jgi:hypothetical protein